MDSADVVELAVALKDEVRTRCDARTADDLQSIRFLIGMMSFEEGLALINDILPAEEDFSGR